MLVVLLVIDLPSLKAQPVAIPQLFKGNALMSKQYGVTSHITWYGFEYDDYKHNVDLIKQCGYNIIRTDYSASNLDYYVGKIDYTRWDNVFNEAKSANLQLLPLIYYNPKSLTINSDRNLKEYVTSCVKRYGDGVAGWEIGNEMDLANAKDGSTPPTEYMAILRETYNAIKETNPNNQVLLGAIGSLENNYLEDLLSAHAADYFDILSIHYYSAHGIPESIIPFYYKLDSLLRRHHYEKPVWLTETGYRSYQGPADQDVFYTEILPKVYHQLGIDISKCSMGLLYDSRIVSGIRNQDNSSIYSGFKSCHLISLDELKNLSVKDCPVLMILFREFFPKGYFEDLKSYVERGGTVVFPEGGAALFNELDLETNELRAVGKRYYKPLHINCLFEWDAEAQRKEIKRISRVDVAIDKTVQYSWHNEDLTSPKYLLDDNLKAGDVMIPIVYGKDVRYTGVVAACYRLNSDLKGNIIIQTRPNHSTYVSEALQASRIPRLFILSYAMGIDKVLPYCLRDREVNNGYGMIKVNDDKKSSFNTIKVLTEFLPSGSSRPKVETENNQYIASWTTPKGEKVYCVWSSWVGQEKSIKVKGCARYYDETGQRIREKNFNVSPYMTYILGASSVAFQ